MKKAIQLTLFLLCIPAFVFSDPETVEDGATPQFSSTVQSIDGKIQLELHVPVYGTAYTRKVTLIGTVRKGNGEEISVTSFQERMIAGTLSEALSSLSLKDLESKTIKDDLKTVLEDEIREILQKDTEFIIQIDKLIVT